MFDENLLPFIARLNPTIMWIALTVGLLVFVIGYFAGGRMAMGRIGVCVLLVTVLGTLALPAPIKLFSLVERGLDVKITVGGTGEETKAKTSPKPKTNNTATATASADTASSEDDIGSNVPFSLQILTLVMYLVWSAFLIGMGIFLYETLTVTAEEAEKH